MDHQGLPELPLASRQSTSARRNQRLAQLQALQAAGDQRYEAGGFRGRLEVPGPTSENGTDWLGSRLYSIWSSDFAFWGATFVCFGKERIQFGDGSNA